MHASDTFKSEMCTGPFSVSQPDQLMMSPKVEFFKDNINILNVVKFIFKNVKSCKHDMHEKYGSL